MLQKQLILLKLKQKSSKSTDAIRLVAKNSYAEKSQPEKLPNKEKQPMHLFCILLPSFAKFALFHNQQKEKLSFQTPSLFHLKKKEKKLMLP